MTVVCLLCVFLPMSGRVFRHSRACLMCLGISAHKRRDHRNRSPFVSVLSFRVCVYLPIRMWICYCVSFPLVGQMRWSDGNADMDGWMKIAENYDLARFHAIQILCVSIGPAFGGCSWENWTWCDGMTWNEKVNLKISLGIWNLVDFPICFSSVLIPQLWISSSHSRWALGRSLVPFSCKEEFLSWLPGIIKSW